MIPLDLLRAATSTAVQNALTSATEIVTTTHTHIDGRDGFNRLVIVVSAMTGATGYAIKLQGSNDQNISDSIEPTNWTDIVTISPTAAGTTSSVFQAEYKYYRIVNTVTAASPSIAYTASIVETYADRWIMYKSLELICRDFKREVNDVWDQRAHEYAGLYDAATKNYKFTVDSNDDNLVTDSDETEAGQTILVR